MEKKRSPRSSKSPATTIFPKSPLVYENYKSGCGWKLINFFDFRHVKSGNKRLSTEKKFIRDSAGNVYTKSQLDLLKRLHEKCQCHARILEEENTCKPKGRRRSLSSENEHEKFESKPLQGLLDREIRRIKNLKEGICDNSLDKEKLSSLSEIENTNDKVMQMDLKNGRDCKKRAEINIQVRVNGTAETLICSKADEKGKDRSKQFMEALDILRSNKELFITLLQDPNSVSAKNGQDLEESKVKERLDNSLLMADELDEIVLLKPRFSSSVDDRVYLRFKHLAKKLKLVIGSNKDSNHAENKLEGSSKARETEAAAFIRKGEASTSRVGHRSPESAVFRRKKRVESDVFKLNYEKNALPRRYTVERQKEKSNSSPVYEVPYALSSLQTKLQERRQRLEMKRESFKLWSLDKNFDVFDPKPHNSGLRRSLDDNCTGTNEYRYLESSLAETNSSLERRDSNIHDPKQEQEQPSPVSVLERIHLEEESVSSSGNVKCSELEEHIGLSFDDQNIDLFEKESIHEFVTKVLEASRLNWSNLMARCNEETSLLDEFSHGNHNNNQLLLVLDYTDEILREIYRKNIMFWPFTPSKNSKVANLTTSSLRKEDLIKETMRCFDWSLVCCDSPRTLDQIIETDLTKPCLDGELEGVVSDIVDKILQQLLLEISHELRTMERRRLCGLI